MKSSCLPNSFKATPQHQTEFSRSLSLSGKKQSSWKASVMSRYSNRQRIIDLAIWQMKVLPPQTKAEEEQRLTEILLLANEIPEVSATLFQGGHRNTRTTSCTISDTDDVDTLSVHEDHRVPGTLLSHRVEQPQSRCGSGVQGARQGLETKAQNSESGTARSDHATVKINHQMNPSS